VYIESSRRVRGLRDGFVEAEDPGVPPTRAQLERQLAAHRRAAPTHRRASLLHGQAADQARRFGDEARELKEHGLEREQERCARMEDKRVEQARVALASLG
jgi:hypothetical protein